MDSLEKSAKLLGIGLAEIMSMTRDVILDALTRKCSLSPLYPLGARGYQEHTSAG